jgi:hypothetical protein
MTIETRNMNISVLWIDKADKTKVIYTKGNGETLILSVGDFITYKTRPHGVRIDSFTNKYDEDGPIGFTYMPWRHEERRWATLSFGIRGNDRHVIAYPCGLPHYGQHIDWTTIKKLDKCPKEGIMDEQLQEEIKCFPPPSLHAHSLDVSEKFR